MEKDCDHALGLIDNGFSHEDHINFLCIPELPTIASRDELYREFKFCPYCGEKLDLDKIFLERR